MFNDIVTYYCGGKKPVIELLVSLYSLRQSYNGKVIICLGKTSVPFLEPLIKSREFKICVVPGTESDGTVREHWRSRWIGMAMISGDRVLHPDCDMVFYSNLDSMFDAIDSRPDYITSFHSVNNGTYFKQWKKHVKEYRLIEPDFNIEKPFYIEFGILGWRGAWPYCMDVSRACEIVKDDQMAMSYVLMKNGRKAYCPPLMNKLMRRARAYYRLDDDDYNAVIAWHCHPSYELWWRMAVPAIKENFMGLGNLEYLKFINRKCFKQYRDKTYPNINYKVGTKPRKKAKKPQQ